MVANSFCPRQYRHNAQHLDLEACLAYPSTCLQHFLRSLAPKARWMCPLQSKWAFTAGYPQHSLQLGISLWHDRNQGFQFQQNLYNKVLGECYEFTLLSGGLMRCLLPQQYAALQLLQWLQAVAPTCHKHLGLWLIYVMLQRQGGNTIARYPGQYPELGLQVCVEAALRSDSTLQYFMDLRVAMAAHRVAQHAIVCSTAQHTCGLHTQRQNRYKTYIQRCVNRNGGHKTVLIIFLGLVFNN